MQVHTRKIVPIQILFIFERFRNLNLIIGKFLNYRHDIKLINTLRYRTRFENGHILLRFLALNIYKINH